MLCIKIRYVYLCAMFVRTKHQVNGKVSSLIVEHVRESCKVRQKTLRPQKYTIVCFKICHKHKNKKQA